MGVMVLLTSCLANPAKDESAQDRPAQDKTGTDPQLLISV